MVELVELEHKKMLKLIFEEDDSYFYLQIEYISKKIKKFF